MRHDVRCLTCTIFRYTVSQMYKKVKTNYSLHSVILGTSMLVAYTNDSMKERVRAQLATRYRNPSVTKYSRLKEVGAWLLVGAEKNQNEPAHFSSPSVISFYHGFLSPAQKMKFGRQAKIKTDWSINSHAEEQHSLSSRLFQRAWARSTMAEPPRGIGIDLNEPVRQAVVEVFVPNPFDWDEVPTGLFEFGNHVFWQKNEGTLRFAVHFFYPPHCFNCCRYYLNEEGCCLG